MKTPDICPVCGEEVPPKVRACPECGADERTGWNEQATRYDGLDLPDSAFGEETGRSGDLPDWIWKAAAVVLILALAWWLVF